MCPASALTVCLGQSRSPPKAFQNTLYSRCRQSIPDSTPEDNTSNSSLHLLQGCPHCLRCRPRTFSTEVTGSSCRARTGGGLLVLLLCQVRSPFSLREGVCVSAANGPEVYNFIKCHLVKVKAKSSSSVRSMIILPAVGL